MPVVECGFIKHVGERGGAWQGGPLWTQSGGCVARSFSLMDVDPNCIAGDRNDRLVTYIRRNICQVIIV